MLSPREDAFFPHSLDLSDVRVFLEGIQPPLSFRLTIEILNSSLNKKKHVRSAKLFILALLLWYYAVVLRVPCRYGSYDMKHIV